MDFTKFVSLISSKSLYFSRSDLFLDPFEGSYSKVNVELRPHVYKDMKPEHYEKTMSQVVNFTKWVREWTYINCWHANNYESAAMWDLYAKTNEAVAIETDYDNLKNVLPDNVHLGCVNYIDYEKEWLPEGNSFYPFTHKRKSFEHEMEIRAIIQELPAEEKGIVVGKNNKINGINITIDPSILIRRIHVAPTAPDWLVALTTEVADKYDISAHIKKSDLYSGPVF